MRYTLFVQSGNAEQAHRNAMLPYVYTFACSRISVFPSFEILQLNGNLSGPYWSVEKEYGTTFRLEFVMD